MYRILRKYKLSNGLYKYVSFPISTKVIDRLEIENININDNKLANNIIRAKSKIKDYVLCNDFKYFITITCNDKNINRCDLDNLRRVVTNIIRYARKKYKITAKYILIPEKHKNGAYHLHGVLDASFLSFIYINKNGYDSLSLFDNIGFTSIEEIRSIDKVSSYITKYVSKDFASVGKGIHLYYCSRGLKQPFVEYDTVYNNDFFDDKFFTIKNDYCYVRYFRNLYLENILRKR